MPTTNRITLALRPSKGETLESLQLYAKLGAPVAVGRSLGVIASLSEGDAIERLHDMEELVSAPISNIDEHVRMARDAARYHYLRDRERIEDPDTDLLVIAGDVWLSGDELDKEVDDAMRLAGLLEKNGEPA